MATAAGGSHQHGTLTGVRKVRSLAKLAERTSLPFSPMGRGNLGYETFGQGIHIA